MSIYGHKRWTIIARTGLLGVTIGGALGLIEAACLRLPHFALAFPRPHVPFAFWFLAPLLASVAFGLLGLLTGWVIVLVKSRFFAMMLIASVAGLAGAYVALIIRFYPSNRTWFVFLHQVVSPELLVTLVFSCALALLWVTATPSSPLGALVHIPIRPWSLAAAVLATCLAVAVGISYLFSGSMASTVHAGGRSKSPNIILIVSDTTRADHLSSYGYFRKTTPNIDGFARRGVLFEDAISASSWTLPAMASIFTGLLPHQHGAGADEPLGNGPKTLPEILRTVGYETAGFSANPHYGISPWGLSRGFDTYTDSTATLGYSVDASRLGHNIIEPLSEQWFHHSRFNEFTAQQLNEQVCDWFAHRSGRPFFLLVHYDDAHDSYEVPSPFDHFYGPISEEAKRLLPEAKYNRAELTIGQRESVIAAYDNALRYIDSQVGELLCFLQQSPDWSNTYIIFTADHGEAFGEHHAYTHGWDLYREVLHVPLVIAGPGVPAGLRITDPASTRQILPTVLEWSGMRHPVLHRRSLSRLWEPRNVPDFPEEPVFSEFLDPATSSSGPQGVVSVTTRDWHIIWHTDHRNQLYRWPSDPQEKLNLFDVRENQEIVQRLEGILLPMMMRSYPPWRDTRYLEALPNSSFSSHGETQNSDWPLPTGRLLPLAPGVVQSVFPPNPETPSRIVEDDMVRSIPYGGP